MIVAKEGRLLTDEEQGRITLRFIDGQISEADVADGRRSRFTDFSLYDMNLPLVKLHVVCGHRLPRASR